MKGISVIRTVGRLRIVKGILGRPGAILHFEMDTVPFHRIRTIRCRRLCSVTNYFRMKILPICLYRLMRNCPCQHCRFSRVPLVPPDIDGIVRMDNNELALMDRRMGEVSVLSMEIWDPPIQGDTLDVRISHGDTEWLCLLYSASSGSARDDTMPIRLDGKGLDHWRGVVWDPGIVGQQCLHVCYDCLCLIALFREVMLLVHDRAAWSLWTGTESGYCRTITWEL